MSTIALATLGLFVLILAAGLMELRTERKRDGALMSAIGSVGATAAALLGLAAE